MSNTKATLSRKYNLNVPANGFDFDAAKVIDMLATPGGVTGRELQVAMKRSQHVSIWSVRNFCQRMGYEPMFDESQTPMRYSIRDDSGKIHKWDSEHNDKINTLNPEQRARFVARENRVAALATKRSPRKVAK